ncbi:hypothetical protein DYB32_009864, partial [Aphanomyces invadans]
MKRLTIGVELAAAPSVLFLDEPTSSLDARSAKLIMTGVRKIASTGRTVTTGDGEELQSVLEELDCENRLKKALELLTKEMELSRVQQSIKEKVEEKVTKNQRQYLLIEQLKTIKKELGLEKDDKEAMLTKFRQRLDNFKIPPNPDTP